MNELKMSNIFKTISSVKFSILFSLSYNNFTVVATLTRYVIDTTFKQIYTQQRVSREELENHLFIYFLASEFNLSLTSAEKHFLCSTFSSSLRYKYNHVAGMNSEGFEITV